MDKKIATWYWSQGCYYQDRDRTSFALTEAELCRRLHRMGYTHYQVQHTKLVNRLLVDHPDIAISKPRRIPKRYRTSIGG